MDDGRLVLLALCLASVIPSSHAECVHPQNPNNWHTFEGKYYYIHTKEPITFNYVGAEMLCERFGGHLATSNSKKLANFFASLIKKKSDVQDSSFWIGLQNKGQEIAESLDQRRQLFSWEDGTVNDPGRYHNWMADEPSFNDRKCAIIKIYNPGHTKPEIRWYSKLCWQRFLFICERADSPCDNTCPGGAENWYQYDETRYYYAKKGNKAHHYTDSNKQCEEIHATLAEIRNEEENEFVAGMLSQLDMTGGYFALRYTTEGTNSDDSVDIRRQGWKSISRPDLEGVLLDPDTFHNWTTGHPRKGDKCARIDRNYQGSPPKSNYFWAGTTCNVKYNYICSRVEKYVRNGLSYSVKTTPDSFHDAQLRCQDMGGSLAILDDEATNTYLTSVLQEEGVQRAWFGLSFSRDNNPSSDVIDRRQNWKWINEAPQQGFADWQTWEPHTADRCVYLGRKTDISSYYWFGQRCSKEFPYICQKPRCAVQQTSGDTEAQASSAIPVSPKIALFTLLCLSVHQYVM